MILVEKIPKTKMKINSVRIYINTLIPNFEFKNKSGKIVVPIKRCISI